MLIRLLYGNELLPAVGLAHEVFEVCVRPYIRTQQEADWFYGYVRADSLWQEISGGCLLMWGAFEQGQLCAVAAMRDSGQITMLYVRPLFQRRRIGMQLVNDMCACASQRLRRDCVTINVMPVSAASYFYHIGFILRHGEPLGNGYVPLERRIWAMPRGTDMTYGMPPKPGQPEVTYPKKRVGAGRMIAIAVVTFLLSFVLIAGVTLHHLMAV